MRDDVDRARLERFLSELGRIYRGRARLTLCGGESFVWRGLRAATRDIDIAYAVEPDDHAAWVRAFVELKERLAINVEEAQPSDFVPVPPGASARDEFIGRFGGVDVFLCDPYSIAMAKLDRGAARDFRDVRALIDAEVLSAARLDDLVEEAIRNDARPRLGFDPARVRRNVRAVVANDETGAAGTSG